MIAITLKLARQRYILSATSSRYVLFYPRVCYSFTSYSQSVKLATGTRSTNAGLG